MKKFAVVALAGCATFAVSSMAVAQSSQRFVQQRTSNNGNHSEIESLLRYEKNEEARAAFMQDPQAMRINWDTARRFAKCANGLNRNRTERLLKQDIGTGGVRTSSTRAVARPSSTVSPAASFTSMPGIFSASPAGPLIAQPVSSLIFMFPPA